MTIFFPDRSEITAKKPQPHISQHSKALQGKEYSSLEISLSRLLALYVTRNVSGPADNVCCGASQPREPWNTLHRVMATLWWVFIERLVLPSLLCIAPGVDSSDGDRKVIACMICDL